MRPPPTFLHVVLQVRKRKEEAEELKLTAINRDLQQLAARENQLREEVTVLAATRHGEVKTLSNAWHHQEIAARFRQLEQARAEVLSERKRLQALRLKQTALYNAARCEREVICELQEQRAAAYIAEVAARDQRRNDELFLSRRTQRLLERT